jgi:flagellar biogenesis protein FliO
MNGIEVIPGMNSLIAYLNAITIILALLVILLFVGIAVIAHLVQRVGEKESAQKEISDGWDDLRKGYWIHREDGKV